MINNHKILAENFSQKSHELHGQTRKKENIQPHF